LGRIIAVLWLAVGASFAFAAVLLIAASRPSSTDAPSVANDGEAPVSQALAASIHRIEEPTLAELLVAADEVRLAGEERRFAVEERRAAALRARPTLAEALVAADQLRIAGALAPEPTLADLLIAADELRIAGALPEGADTDPLNFAALAAEPPSADAPSADELRAASWLGTTPGSTAGGPSYAEVLVAADQLRLAGVIAGNPDQPTYLEILVAADVMARASAHAQSMSEAMRAAVILSEAARPAPPPPARPAAPAPRPAAPPPPPPAPPPAAEPVAAAPQAGPGGWYDASFSGQVMALVNQRRASAGLVAVVSEGRLTNAAAAYARVLADHEHFSHTGPDGSTIVTRVEAAGFPFNVQIGEVLAWGSDGWQPGEIVQAWIDSPSHREQIMGAVYRRAGVSCYFTQEATVVVRCVMDLAG
jgi:uncharacterized protein YkwD